MNNQRIYLNVSFDGKNEVRRLGAKWDSDNRGWWITKQGDLKAFNKWLPRMYKLNAVPPHVKSEMIPYPNWYINLRSLLPESEWDVLRKKCYADAGHRCQVCGQKGDKWPVECNEQWEYIEDSNSDFSIQKLRRLAALCPTCHSIKHLGKASVDGNLDEVLQHMAYVNGWTEQKCDEYAEQAFELWEKRSEMSWIIDLSILSNLDIEKIYLNNESIHIVGISISYLNIFNNLSFLINNKTD